MATGSRKQTKARQAKLVCVICGGRVDEEEVRYGDEGANYVGKPLCETCYYEIDTDATVLYRNDDEPHVITSTRNETDGDFTLAWHSTDPYRGYFETRSERYVLVSTAELLWGHDSEEMLADFDKRIRAAFDEAGIDYARVFARSSNVFYQNYDLFVKKRQSLLASVLVGLVKKKVDYDNPKWGRGILFDEPTLSKLASLFPEEAIKTDADAVRLAEKHGEDLVPEIVSRLRTNQPNNGGQE
ncbi:MAG: hypothetical protein JRM94_03225 [Nitrososphaerota archaeon]|jgi:hypothetical protein|nr:hypothetical protein [Nitrososphaerota archaeon]